MTAEAIKKAEEELKVPSKPPKINRDVPITPSKTETNENESNKVSLTDSSPKGKENAPVVDNSTEAEVSPVKVKLSEEEVEAKIKARAERFGGFQSEDAKKTARAARYLCAFISNNLSTKVLTF